MLLSHSTKIFCSFKILYHVRLLHVTAGLYGALKCHEAPTVAVSHMSDFKLEANFSTRYLVAKQFSFSALLLSHVEQGPFPKIKFT